MCKDTKKDWHLKYPEGMFVIYYYEKRGIWIAEQHLEKPNAWSLRLRQWDISGEKEMGASISNDKRAIFPQSSHKKKEKKFNNKMDFKRECGKLGIDVSSL